MPSNESPRSRRSTGSGVARPSRILLLALLVWFALLAGWAARVELTPARFYDERFSVANVLSVIEAGRLSPANGWYPSLSFLPQAMVIGGAHKALGMEVERPNGDLSAAGYLVARWVSVAWGVLALVLTYLIGRRLWSRPVALLGVALLAMTPWMLQVSISFKPDAVVMALMLLAFYASLRATERMSWGSWVVAGLCVGASLAAKWNGALIAMPLIVATVAIDWRRPAHWLRLAAAGVASLATFVVLNPNLPFYWHYFQRVNRFHGDRPETFLGMLKGQLAFLIEGDFHGRFGAALALMGLLVILAEARRQPDRLRRVQLLMFAGFPVLYLIVYSVLSSYPKNNNVTPILPFTALAAAVLVDRLCRLVDARAAERWKPWLYVLLVATALLGPAIRGHRFAYGQGVPTTTLKAALSLAQEGLRFVDHRVFVVERSADDGRRDRRARARDRPMAGERTVDAMAPVAAETLDLADAEIFRAETTEGPLAAFFRGRIERLTEPPLEVRPKLFRVRGPELILLRHPWRHRRQTVPVVVARSGAGAEHEWSGRPAEPLRTGETVSVEVAVREWDNTPTVRVGERELFVFPTNRARGLRLFATERIRTPGPTPPIQVRLQRAPSHPELPAVALWRWGRPPQVVRPGGN